MLLRNVVARSVGRLPSPCTLVLALVRVMPTMKTMDALQRCFPFCGGLFRGAATLTMTVMKVKLCQLVMVMVRQRQQQALEASTAQVNTKCSNTKSATRPQG